MYSNRTELMLYTRSELMLLTRCGRLPPGTRAGPEPQTAVARRRRRDDRPRLPARGVAALAQSRRQARRARLRERYLELEFAVGFPPEDELPTR